LIQIGINVAYRSFMCNSRRVAWIVWAADCFLIAAAWRPALYRPVWEAKATLMSKISREWATRIGEVLAHDNIFYGGTYLFVALGIVFLIKAIAYRSGDQPQPALHLR
jgi:hypothetical protein